MGWTFALPPSVGWTLGKQAFVRQALAPVGFTQVRAALSYQALTDELLEGKVDAAWVPPLVGAALEQAGARVILRAVRGGTSSYRAALFARADRELTLEGLRGQRLRAAWLDEKSMSGYVLPRKHLESLGLRLEEVFVAEKCLGSSSACVQAVLEGKADVSATFASPPTAPMQRLGFLDIAGERAAELTTLGFSRECPNDGVALSPRRSAGELRELTTRFHDVLRDPAALSALSRALEVDALDTPPAGAYQQLREYLR
ncbi:MAG: PhnD/SsuA/transferrin family substrate-binding protein [Myxococcota bacterium]